MLLVPWAYTQGAYMTANTTEYTNRKSLFSAPIFLSPAIWVSTCLAVVTSTSQFNGTENVHNMSTSTLNNTVMTNPTSTIAATTAATVMTSRESTWSRPARTYSNTTTAHAAMGMNPSNTSTAKRGLNSMLGTPPLTTVNSK